MRNETTNVDDGREQKLFRRLVATLALMGATLVGGGGVFLFFLARDIAYAEPWVMELFRGHPEAVLGLPTAALAALGIVLRHRRILTPVPRMFLRRKISDTNKEQHFTHSHNGCKTTGTM